MTANRRAILLMLAFVLLWAGIEAMAANVLRHYSRTRWSGPAMPCTWR